jgi:hypothetical protein
MYVPHLFLIRPGQYSSARTHGSVHHDWMLPMSARSLKRSLNQVMPRSVMMWKTDDGMTSRFVLN